MMRLPKRNKHRGITELILATIVTFFSVRCSTTTTTIVAAAVPFTSSSSSSRRHHPSVPLTALRGGGPFIKKKRAGRGGDSNSNNGATTTMTMASSLESLVATRRRRACSFYVWDMPSALLYKWTQHLLKDCVYEGRGGKKFVRIRPGSVLQLLYPSSSNYSPDKCLICGGCFRDHLRLWWAKHLYTPYDRLLDETYARGVVLLDDSSADNTGRQRASTSRRNRKTAANWRKREKKSRISSSSSGSTSVPHRYRKKYAFHRQYVLDKTHALKGIPSNKKRAQRRAVRLAMAERGMKVPANRQGGGRGSTADTDLLEEKQCLGAGVSYLFPKPPPGKRVSLTLELARRLSLEVLNGLIELEALENTKEEETSAIII